MRSRYSARYYCITFPYLYINLCFRKYTIYSLNDKKVTPVRVQYEFVKDKDAYIRFEQRILDGSDFTFNSESGYSKIVEIEYCDVYYRYTETYHSYVWNDGKYALSIRSNRNISPQEIELIIRGIQ